MLYDGNESRKSAKCKENIVDPGSPRSYFVGSSDLLRKEVLKRTSAIVFHSRSEVLKRTSARGLFDGPSLLVLA